MVVFMKQTKVTLNINSDIYQKFKKQSKSYGLIISKQIELFMESEIKKNKNHISSEYND